MDERVRQHLITREISIGDWLSFLRVNCRRGLPLSGSVPGRPSGTNLVLTGLLFQDGFAGPGSIIVADYQAGKFRGTFCLAMPVQLRNECMKIPERDQKRRPGLLEGPESK